MRAWIRLGLLALAVAGCRGAVETEAPPPPAPASASVRIMAGGDVMFGRWGRQAYIALDGGPAALATLRPLFEPATVSLVNLETALCHGSPDALDPSSPPTSPRVLLTSSPDLATDALRAAGIDVAIVANNHALDCGPTRFAETLEALDAAGIGIAGASRDDSIAHEVFATEAGARVHVLAVSERPIPGWRAARAPRPAMITDHPRLRTELVAAVEAVRREDPDGVLVVSLHWGGELTPTPLPGQRVLAGELVEAGAQVVLGHHSHVVQPFEVHSGAVIAYSLGNLVFDMRQPESLPTGVLDVELEPDAGGRPRVVRVDWHARLRDGATFVPLDDDAWLDDLAERSTALGVPAERVASGLRWTLRD